MSRRSTLLLLGIALLLAPAALIWLRPAPEAVAAPAPPEKLSDKPLYIHAKDNVNYVLSKPEVRQLGGRSFLVGKQDVDNKIVPRKFGSGLVWVPIENVLEIVELEPSQLK